MNENNYYHNFKTRPKSRLEERLGSHVRTVNSGLQKNKKLKSRQPRFDNKKSTNFLLVFLSRVKQVEDQPRFFTELDRVNDSPSFFKLKLIHALSRPVPGRPAGLVMVL
jgi:hypothetical protein